MECNLQLTIPSFWKHVRSCKQLFRFSPSSLIMTFNKSVLSKILSEQMNHLDFRKVARKHTWNNCFLILSCMILACFHEALKFLFGVVCSANIRNVLNSKCVPNLMVSVCACERFWLRTKLFVVVFPFLSSYINYI